MVVCSGHKIRQVNMASIINTIDSILYDCAMILYMFSSYHSLTNNEYITISRHYHVLIASIVSVPLMMVLPIGISELTFIDPLHISTFGADFISFDVLYYKGTLV